MTRQLKVSELQGVRAQVLLKQGGKCAICGKPIKGRDVATFDHDHDTGFLRGVLHASCNGVEGKVKAMAHRSHAGVLSAEYLIGLGKYLEFHKIPRLNALHPTYKSPAQKRDARNAAARKRRAAKKGK